ncbi:MAG: DUF2207 domain-containing protein [Coriobacteriales bacterium]|nr:DUF2207 domain-containing protein [Coriobacteriales bacterium]
MNLAWRRISLVLTFMATCLFLVFAVLPSTAYARSYAVTQVHILGEGKTDGTFVITELRTLEFKGEFHAVDWFIPENNSAGLEVVRVCEVDDNGHISVDYPFDTSEDPGTWSMLRMDSGEIRVSANFVKADETVTFGIQYRVKGALKAWSDTAELNWQAIGPKTSVPTEDVEIWIKLPVPESEAITLGENVRAWADGPLTGYLEQDEDGDIHLVCPEVEPGQYLSVLSAFPVEWLNEVTPSEEPRLEEIMTMGRDIAKAANDERARARMIEGGINYGYPAVASVVSIGGLGFLLSRYFKYCRRGKRQFRDKYWRDVPSDDHPAVIGTLWRGKTSHEDLSATLMKLTSDGVMRIDKVRVDQKLSTGKIVTKDDYMLTLNEEKYKKLTDGIDLPAAQMLFKTIPKGRKGGNGYGGVLVDSVQYANTGASPVANLLTENSICFSEVKSCSGDYYSEFSSYYSSWSSAINQTIWSRKFYNREALDWGDRMKKIGAVTVVISFFLLMLSIEILPLIPSLMVFISGLIVMILGFFMDSPKHRRSDEAREILAKTKALRKWLCDFTNLKEAIPTDVILWNRLLVMATVLGVSERVIEQLQIAAPQVLANLEFSNMYTWCSPSTTAGIAASFFASQIDHASRPTSSYSSSSSTHDIASSRDSSESGSSGGFGGGGHGSSFGGSSFGGGGFGAR